MTKVFKKLFFLIAIVVVVQCDSEQTTEAEVDLKTSQEVKILSFEALPVEIQSKIFTTKEDLKSTITHHKGPKAFGNPKLNRVHQRLSDNGR